MIEYSAGSLAKSKAGHDKGNLFIIFGESGEYVILVDGNLRPLEKPKYKNKKHVQLIHRRDEILSGKLESGERVTNEEIRRFIGCYKRENQVI